MARVLVVETDDSLREMLREVLSLDAHAVELAEDLDTAIARLRSGRYDVVLSDTLGPPNTTARWENLQLIKEAAGATPIVLLTGFTEAVPLDPEEIGVAVVLSKPADIDDLLNAIRRAISPV